MIRPGAGGEGLRVLGVDPALDGVAVEADVLLCEAERSAGGDPDHLAHQIDAADHLGHRMLDLQAGVHLDEVELAVLVQELEGADAAIAELGDGLGGDAADRARAALRSSAGEGASSSTF